MPKPPNRALRIAVPLVVAALGVGLAWMVFRGGGAAGPGGPAPAAPAPSAGAPEVPIPKAEEKPAVAEQPKPAPTSAAPALAAGAKLRARANPGPPVLTVLGGLDASAARAEVVLSPTGLGVRSFSLSDAFTTIKRDQHEQVQGERRVVYGGGRADVLAPLAALAVEVTPAGGSAQVVPVFGELVWRGVEGRPGTYEAVIEDEAGSAVVRLERRYELSARAPDLVLRQRVENLTGTALSVRLFQVGPVDMAEDVGGYGGDKRKVRFGFLLPPEQDPSQSVVLSNDLVLGREKVLGKRAPVTGADGRQVTDAQGNVVRAYGETRQWPNATSDEGKLKLSWVGMTNRYFGVAVHPVIDPSAKAPDKTLSWVEQVTRIALDPGGNGVTMALRLDGKRVDLSPAGVAGAGADLSLGMYAGPLDRRRIKAEPVLESLGVVGLIYYNFGGMCGWCTFAWITEALYGVLNLLHDYVFRDWALSIIFLVVVVRGLLHPVTRWSQIKTARFGKQMQAVAPKQKALQEKYRDDPAKLQAETRKLWSEEGINPAGFLGCVPMFLQTPVWIALYATLYFAYELRHEAAFYGVAQAVIPAGTKAWWFLGDLAEPDRLVYFGRELVNLPLLGPIMSVNVLPVVLGLVFYAQQKYLTQAQPQAMTPEQELQMKMMKWMMVFMFPVAMYNAPAGLSLYFIANSTLGIIESKWIRRYMDKHGLLDVEKMKAERKARQAARGKPTAERSGFLGKLLEMAEEQQRRTGRGPGR